MPTRVLVRVGACLLAASSASACAAAVPASPSASAPLSARDERDLRTAELTLTGACMRQAGFRYVAEQPQEPRAEVGHVTFGLDDVATAARHGFHQSDVATADERRRRGVNTLYYEQLAPQRRAAFLTALYGGDGDPRVSVTLPPGVTVSASRRGCQAQAQNRLYGDFARWFSAATVVDNLPGAATSRAMADPAYTRRLATWSACMRASSYPASSPQDLRTSFEDRSRHLDAGQAARLERRMATAEAVCVRETGLSALGERLQSAYLARGRQEHANVVAAYERMRREALTRAPAVMAEARAAGAATPEPTHLDNKTGGKTP